MIKIERKIIKNKPFFYLSDQIRINNKYKKIQAYIGKNIPKDLSKNLNILEKKEIDHICNNINNIFTIDRIMPVEEFKKIETLRIKWKYYLYNLSISKQEKLWRKFAIQFIYESNAIEGSRLSQKEVETIVLKKYINKKINRKEIREVNNAIQAFNIIRSKGFKLNQKSIINLHKIIIQGLGIDSGYKKRNIVVNNKDTASPGEVRSNMAELLSWWKKKQKARRHPLLVFADFHNRFERIHPFADGNGRVGRLIFNWMLFKAGYGAILFKNRTRQSYFEALNQADKGRSRKWYWHCVRVYKKTISDLM